MLKKPIRYLLAEDEELLLEERLTITFIAIGVFFSLLGTFFMMTLIPNLVTIITALFLTCFLSVAYYFIRFKRIIKPFILPVILSFYIGISIIWVYGGGINGPNILPGLVILCFSLIVVPLKMRFPIVLLFIADFISIHLIQYYRPDLIINYTSEKNRWIDTILTFTYTCFGLYFVISFMHKHYTIEKRKAEFSEIKIQKQNLELQKLNSDKDTFITILAHDLKSPFNSMLGFSELLLMNIRKYDIDKIEEQLVIINETAQITYVLFEDLLLWARTQSGKISYEPEYFNLIEICNEVLGGLLTSANNKEITLSLEVRNHISLLADKNMLKTILRNLITNAIKFTNRLGQVRIIVEESDKYLTFIISDNGIGISPESLVKIWDLTSSISTVGTANERGTGFGLLLCKDFVEKHGGTIWVDSELGKGSQFKFTIPKDLDLN